MMGLELISKGCLYPARLIRPPHLVLWVKSFGQALRPSELASNTPHGDLRSIDVLQPQSPNRLTRKCYGDFTPPPPLKSFNSGIRQTQAAVKVIRHDTDGIVDRVLKPVEHWTIEGISTAEYPSCRALITDRKHVINVGCLFIIDSMLLLTTAALPRQVS